MKPALLVFLPLAGLAAGWFLRPLIPAGSPLLAGDPAAAASAPGSPLVFASAGPGGAVAKGKSEAFPAIKPSNPKAAIKSLFAFSRAAKNPRRSQAQLLAFADQLAPADLKALALEAANQPGRYWAGDDSVKSILLSRWAEIAPAEALAYATQNNTPQSREALGDIFGQLAVSDPQRAEAALASLSGGPRQNALRSMAVRLASLDPLGAMTLLSRQKAAPGDYASYSVMAIWARQDASGAAAYAAALPDGPQRRQAFDSIANGMAQHDPAAALAWAQALPKASESANLVRQVIGNVAARDPQAALALAEAQPPREQRQLLRDVAQNWMRQDGPAALAWIKGMADSPTRQDCLSSMAYFASTNGPETVREILDLLPKGRARRETLQGMAANMAWQDPAGAQAWAKTLPAEDRELVIGSLSSSLAETDPSAAAAMVQALPASLESIGALSNIANVWAGKDPEAALAWAATLDSDKARQDATAAALNQWADRDPEKAAGATGQIADAHARRAARDTIASSWARRAPAEAEQWARSLPPEDRYSALSQVWNASAADNPSQAAASLAAIMPAAEGVAGAAASLTSSAGAVAAAWVGQDPPAAANWAVGLPEGKARDAAVAAVADQWAGSDTMAASTWINNLPAGPSRDQAAARLIDKIAPTDPGAALAWAANIQDPERQWQSLKNTVNSWKVYNPEAARQALDGANLDEATRTKLQAELK